MQDGYADKLAAHKELIEAKMSAAVTLVKVLQITDSKAFVTTYGQLLEQRHQNPEAMQRCLALLDISKDVAVTRLNMFRSLGNAGGLAGVRPFVLTFLRAFLNGTCYSKRFNNTIVQCKVSNVRCCYILRGQGTVECCHIFCRTAGLLRVRLVQCSVLHSLV